MDVQGRHQNGEFIRKSGAGDSELHRGKDDRFTALMKSQILFQGLPLGENKSAQSSRHTYQQASAALAAVPG